MADANLARFAEAKSGSRGGWERERVSPTAATAASAETIEQRALREVRDMVVETGRTPWWRTPTRAFTNAWARRPWRTHRRGRPRRCRARSPRALAAVRGRRSVPAAARRAVREAFQATRAASRLGARPGGGGGGPRAAQGPSPAVRVAASRLDRGLSASSRNSMSAPQSLRSAPPPRSKR